MDQALVHRGLVARAKAIVLKPREEWPVISSEKTSIAGMFLGYAAILAAIPAIAQFLRSVLFGYGALGFSYRPGFTASLGAGISQYLLSLISVAIIAFVTDFVVTKFDGQANRNAAFKLAIYGSTAAWLSGIFQLIPGLGVLGLLGLYSLYLVYLGLTPLMQVPREKALACTAVILLAVLVVNLAAAAVLAPVSAIFSSGSPDRTEVVSGGSVSVPGVGSIDLGKLEQAGRDMESAATKAQETPIDAARLKAFLPQTLGNYSRTTLESSSMGTGGIGGSQVGATYEGGDRTVKVELIDLAAAGAFAGMGAALNVQNEQETETGFERTRTQNGQMVTEKWNSVSGRGEYSTTFGGRFILSVKGDAESFEAIKGLAARVDIAGIERLAE
ncbi:MAG: Yip1 family protein [Allopontixanthobacter sediminis]